MRGFFYAAAWLLVSWYATIPSFWLAIHPFTGFWRRRPGSPYKIILPLWVGMIAAAAGATYPWRHVRLYETPYSWIAGIALFATAISVYHGARGDMTSAQVMGRAEVQPEKHEQKLATSGMHGRVRHPLYLGHLLMMSGWTVGSGLAVCYALEAFAIVTGALMVRLEERELEQRFGDAYREYKRRTPALVPRLAPPGSAT